MKIKLQLKREIINFFKKHRRKIIIILSVWLVVLAINYLVGKFWKSEIEIDTNYKPHEAIMETGEVPKKLQEPIEELIGKFVEYCNKKDYDSAYNLLSEDCKNNIYSDKELFKKYVDSVFYTEKIYNIQNFSNKDNVYIYTVNILNNILASGLNDEDDENVYSEKYVIINENDELKLSIRQYIGREKLSYMYEDDYMKIKIESIDRKYDNVVYNISIANKSEYCIVYADYTVDYEISLDTSEGLKRRADEVLEPIIVDEGETSKFNIKYTIFYDENTEINGMLFDYIRIYKDEESYENGENTIDDFAIKILF